MGMACSCGGAEAESFRDVTPTNPRPMRNAVRYRRAAGREYERERQQPQAQYRNARKSDPYPS